jgi:hypothetical protein
MKISPIRTELNFTINDDPVCINVTIFPEDIDMIMTTLWTRDSPGFYENYTLSAKNAKIGVVSKKIKHGKYEICFSPERAGMLYGIVLFKQKTGLIRIGTWVNINVTGGESIETINIITGNIIGVNKTNIWLMIIFILLMAILFLIVRKMG